MKRGRVDMATAAIVGMMIMGGFVWLFRTQAISSGSMGWISGVTVAKLTITATQTVSQILAEDMKRVANIAFN